jgi:hypothetical protein
MRATLFTLLLLLGIFRFGALAAIDVPNFDEEAGIGESLDIPVSVYLMTGPQDQLSTSPLHYLVDKAWIAAFGGAPHRHYNLNLFFRALPIIYTSVASGLALLLTIELALSAGFPFWISAAFGAVAGIFFSQTSP